MTARDIILNLPKQASPEQLKGIETLFHFDLSADDAGTYTIEVSNGVLETKEGMHGNAKCVVTTKGATLLGLVKGEINPMMAVLTGKVKISNNEEVMKYAKLFSLM
ncbi:MAG: SCP2 sterol-binding domain-containing protein [Bacteroidota bacterium]